MESILPGMLFIFVFFFSTILLVCNPTTKIKTQNNKHPNGIMKHYGCASVDAEDAFPGIKTKNQKKEKWDER